MIQFREVSLAYFFSFFVATFLGCQNDKPQLHTHEPEPIVTAKPAEFTGEKYAYLSGIIHEGESYFAIAKVAEHYAKNSAEGLNIKEKKGLSDSLEILELPDKYIILTRATIPDKFLLSQAVAITMQTFSFDSTGNYKFNEKLPVAKFLKLFNDAKYQRFKKIPFVLTFKNNVVTQVAEQYLP